MKYYKHILLSFLLAFIILGCSSKTPYTNRSQMIFMSVSEELSLGEKTYKETLKKSKVINNTKESRK